MLKIVDADGWLNVLDILSDNENVFKPSNKFINLPQKRIVFSCFGYARGVPFRLNSAKSSELP